MLFMVSTFSLFLKTEREERVRERDEWKKKEMYEKMSERKMCVRERDESERKRRARERDRKR